MVKVNRLNSFFDKNELAQLESSIDGLKELIEAGKVDGEISLDIFGTPTETISYKDALAYIENTSGDEDIKKELYNRLFRPEIDLLRTEADKYAEIFSEFQNVFVTGPVVLKGTDLELLGNADAKYKNNKWQIRNENTGQNFWRSYHAYKSDEDSLSYKDSIHNEWIGLSRSEFGQAAQDYIFGKEGEESYLNRKINSGLRVVSTDNVSCPEIWDEMRFDINKEQSLRAQVTEQSNAGSAEIILSLVNCYQLNYKFFNGTSLANRSDKINEAMRDFYFVMAKNKMLNKATSFDPENDKVVFATADDAHQFINIIMGKHNLNDRFANETSKSAYKMNGLSPDVKNLFLHFDGSEEKKVILDRHSFWKFYDTVNYTESDQREYLNHLGQLSRLYLSRDIFKDGQESQIRNSDSENLPSTYQNVSVDFQMWNSELEQDPIENYRFFKIVKVSSHSIF